VHRRLPEREQRGHRRREEVGRGHDVHWLRVDRYYQGELDAPAINP
jgi:hypothetical protein